MSEFYSGRNDEEATATIELAVHLGITHFDTADMYGPFANERFIGRRLAAFRERVQIATKFGYERRKDGSRIGLNGRPEYARWACDQSLRRLGIESIDLYYLHRIDPTVPVEETVGAMADLVRQGKVRYLGLSEASVESLNRANRVHPIAALQTEYSLVSRDVESQILPSTRRAGIGFVAYAPLGRGLLSGRFQSPEDVPADDYRRHHPRFSTGNLPCNIHLVGILQRIAKHHDATAAQVALAWLLQRSPDIVVLVGTTRRDHLLENVTATSLRLSSGEIYELEETFSAGAVAGERYADMSRVNR